MVMLRKYLKDILDRIGEQLCGQSAPLINHDLLRNSILARIGIKVFESDNSLDAILASAYNRNIIQHSFLLEKEVFKDG